MSSNEQQCKFIEALVQAKANVSVFLQNGIKLQGYIASQDDTCIILTNTSTQLVYKTAISTIMPGTANK